MILRKKFHPVFHPVIKVSRRKFLKKLRNVKGKVFNEIDQYLFWNEEDIKDYAYGHPRDGYRVYKLILRDGSFKEWNLYRNDKK